MSETAGEKTFAPTEKRLTDAAKNGDVLRSKELGTAAALMGGAAALKFTGPWLLDNLGQSLRSGLVWNRAVLDDFAPGQILLHIGWLALPPVLLLGAVVIAVTLIAQLGLAGPGKFNPGNIVPKASRLSPAAGLSRMFGAQGWIEVGKGLLKIGLLGAIAYGWSSSRLGALASLSPITLSGKLVFAWDALTSLLIALCAGLLVIASIDWPIEWLRRRNRLMMSQQEIRDEHKEAEGAPEKKQAIRSRQRQLAMSGVASAMRKAQFVITNPSHFSVAMSYDPDVASAPIVVAKGRGEKALAMRELAAELNVPCLEFPALARSVYYTTRERQMIHEELYAAVAGVLAFVFSLKRGEQRPVPNIDIPVALRFDADGRLENQIS